MSRAPSREKVFSPYLSYLKAILCINTAMPFTLSAAQDLEPSCLSLPENQFYGSVCVCLFGIVA